MISEVACSQQGGPVVMDLSVLLAILARTYVLCTCVENAVPVDT